jgi:hypothetical protein
MTGEGMDEDAVNRLEAQRCRALLDADVAALERLTGADYQHVETGGTTRDRAGFLAAIARPDHRFVLWVIEESRTVLHGDVAIVTGRYRNQVRTPAGLQPVKQARFVRVWVRRDGAWQNVVHQATAIAC